jgi:GNAT superfamily N-acetyltransferase
MFWTMGFGQGNGLLKCAVDTGLMAQQCPSFLTSNQTRSGKRENGGTFHEKQLTVGRFSRSLHAPTMAVHLSSRIPRLAAPIPGTDTTTLEQYLATTLAARNRNLWKSYSWQASALSGFPVSGADLLRPATREEGEEILDVIMLAVSMDSAWNDSLSLMEKFFRASIARLFNAEEPACLVVPKGNRIVAASLLDPDADAVIQLVSGPAVLMEYRNRGIGTRLLHASITALRDRGISKVSALTRSNSIADRYVYPKFGGRSEIFLLQSPVQQDLSLEAKA